MVVHTRKEFVELQQTTRYPLLCDFMCVVKANSFKGVL